LFFHIGLDIDKQISICVEPGIFEWLGWYNQSGLPDWMNNDELIAAGFNINSKYEALVSLSLLIENMIETVEQYYIRCDDVVQNLIKTTESKGNNTQSYICKCSKKSFRFLFIRW